MIQITPEGTKYLPEILFYVLIIGNVSNF